MNDILGQAIYNYQHNERKHKLWIHNRYGAKEEMPVKTYFRDEDNMPDLEWLALNECRGKVLDIGAGAGSHALILQERGFDVTALEISPLAAKVMQERGVSNIIETDIFKYNSQQYDTLLLLMNGIGLTGSLRNLRAFLRHAKTLLNKGGQLLFDSSDVTYLYEDGLPKDRYHGEIWYEYEYQRQKSGWFSWLYIDKQTLLKIAGEEGWTTEVLLEDELGQYLVRLMQVNSL
ncbi:methyltransferase domain-containing protein [Mucilaginibacter limnophilus]|uniref:Methyltransferase domain-containing protein n=1 Tax=Mucilaginibacter limnophilus TaxID=1932778 RepID=A0A437MK59_9SPHI|nr:methyltransferase domain-containing protein [Mucilaginibacter limnophilus]RVT98040.1 methyltransferase domain-containing protein [Mucilaginibacter limnophilus]